MAHDTDSSYGCSKLDKAVDREVENASRNKEGLNQRSIVSLAMKDEKSIMSRPELKISTFQPWIFD